MDITEQEILSVEGPRIFTDPTRSVEDGVGFWKLQLPAQAMMNQLNAAPVSAGPSQRARYLALARTALEQSMFWAQKAYQAE